MPVLATEPTIKRSLELLTSNDWVLLQAGARQITFAPGEALITQDSPGGTLFLLRSGSAKIVADNVALATIGAGQICGELAFLDKRPSSASVIAEEATEADAIDWAELHRIFRMFPNVAARFYQSLAVMLSRRLRETSSALASARQL